MIDKETAVENYRKAYVSAVAATRAALDASWELMKAYGVFDPGITPGDKEDRIRAAQTITKTLQGNTDKDAGND